MEQDIKILEDYIELIKKGYCEDCNELCNIYGAPTYPAKKISEATEHLIKAYKELEEKNKKKSIEIICYQEELENSIPVSLVEETKGTLKTMKENIDKKYLKSRNSVAIESALNLLEKKDKMIDLMAIAIGNEPLPTEEYCIFRNFDCPAVGGNRDCKECVKQYFERKIEQ